MEFPVTRDPGTTLNETNVRPTQYGFWHESLSTSRPACLNHIVPPK